MFSGLRLSQKTWPEKQCSLVGLSSGIMRNKHCLLVFDLYETGLGKNILGLSTFKKQGQETMFPGLFTFRKHC